MREPRIEKKAERNGTRLPAKRRQEAEAKESDLQGAGHGSPQRLGALLSKLSGPSSLIPRSQLLNRMQQTYGNRYVQKAVQASRASQVTPAGREQDADRLPQGAGLDRLLDIVKQKRASNVLDWTALASCFSDADIPLAERTMLALAVRSAHGDGVMVQMMELTPQGKALHSYLVSREIEASEPAFRKQDASSAERVAYRLERSAGSGLALSAGTQREMESLMVSRFGDVRVHADRQAASLASALGVQAFTIGHDIFFGGNKFLPDTVGGKALLAHELAHVVQQQNAGTASTHLISRPDSSSALETEAHRAAVAIACGLPILVTARTSSMSLQGAAVVLSATIPAARSGIVNSGGHVHEYFGLNIDWDTTTGTPAHGEYRQYIKGYFKINGVEITKPLWGGANLEKTVYHEDGTGGSFRYGHRAEAGSTTDVFSNPDRATGSRYRGQDDPGVTGPAGTTVDMKLDFKGQTYDTSTATHGTENLWTVSFAGTIA